MKRLQQAELAAVLAVVGQIYRFSDLSTFRQHMVRSLSRSLIPADQTSGVEIDVRALEEPLA